MLPKNDSEYVKNVIIAALAIFAGAFVVFFVFYSLLNERIILTLMLVGVFSFALFLKDMFRSLVRETKNVFSRLLKIFSGE